MNTPDDAPRSRFRPAPWLVVALVVLLLVAGLAVVLARRDGDGGGEVGAGTSSTTSAASSTVPSTTTAPSLSQVPPAQRKLFDELMAQTAEIRGLAWKQPLNVRLVSQEEFPRVVAETNARDTDPARLAAEEARLKLLGQIPADADLAKLLEDLYKAAVGGFYDPKTRQMVLVEGEELDGAAKATIVHEMVHALTDQQFDYGPRYVQLDEADRTEEAFAFSSLLEGDAKLTESIWMDRHLDPLEALAAALGLGGSSESAEGLANAPPYLVKSLLFPYTEGLAFVEGLHNAGGFAAVDGAYKKPPTSSEHIMHPSTYSSGQGSVSPPLPDLGASSDCQNVRTGVMGEFDMRELLGEQLGASEAQRAAEGWNGDTYALVRCGSTLAMADRWETDPGVDASRLSDALSRWSRGWSGGRGPGTDGRFSGPGGAGRITRSGNRVELVLSQDAGTADRLARVLG